MIFCLENRSVTVGPNFPKVLYCCRIPLATPSWSHIFSLPSCYYLAMSIAGYFGRTRELRMSRKPSLLGIGFEGEVLTGQKSVEEKQRHEAILATNPVDEAYKDVEDYDPVLLYHTRVITNEMLKRAGSHQAETRTATAPPKKYFADEPNK